MILPPPSPTLFPYTTLFRSVLIELGASLERTRHAAMALQDQDGVRYLGGPRKRPATPPGDLGVLRPAAGRIDRSEEHTSELQSHVNLVCRLLLEKKNITMTM